MEITVREQGSVIIMDLSGHFTIYDITDIETIWNGYLKKNILVMALNCREIQFIDSSAIGSLVKMVNLVTGFGIEVIFYDLGEPVQRVFAVTGLNRILNIMSAADFEKRFSVL